MKVGRLIGAMVAIAVIGMAGMAAFAYANRHYPNPVFYERLSIGGSALQPGPEQIELWVDPQRNVELRTNRIEGYRYDTLIDRDGRRERSFRDGIVSADEPVPASEAEATTRDWQQLRRGGFRALAEARLASAIGVVSRVAYEGHQALRFATGRHSGQTRALIAWIDAATHEPLALQVDTAEYSFTQRVLQTQRIAPGTLPPGFFDPPRARSALWDGINSWLGGLFGGR